MKSAPIPPEYARPERILSLRAAPAAGGIMLSGNAPSRYTSGHEMRDLGDFVLMRAEGDGPMTALVKLPVTDQERFQVENEFSYLDGETTMGNTTDTSSSRKPKAAIPAPLPTKSTPPGPGPYRLPTPTPINCRPLPTDTP